MVWLIGADLRAANVGLGNALEHPFTGTLLNRQFLGNTMSQAWAFQSRARLQYASTPPMAAKRVGLRLEDLQSKERRLEQDLRVEQKKRKTLEAEASMAMHRTPPVAAHNQKGEIRIFELGVCV